MMPARRCCSRRSQSSSVAGNPRMVRGGATYDDDNDDDLDDLDDDLDDDDDDDTDSHDD